MRRLLLLLSVSAALFTALYLGASAVQAQQPDREQVALSTGCNLKAFIPSYQRGGPLSAITTDIAGGNPRLWFQVPGTPDFQLYDPRSEERSGVTTLNQEAGFVCVDQDTTWDRPALRR